MLEWPFDSGSRRPWLAVGDLGRRVTVSDAAVGSNSLPAPTLPDVVTLDLELVPGVGTTSDKTTPTPPRRSESSRGSGGRSGRRRTEGTSCVYPGCGRGSVERLTLPGSTSVVNRA